MYSTSQRFGHTFSLNKKMCPNLWLYSKGRSCFLSHIRSPVAGQLMVTSLLVVNLTELDAFGLYSCTVRNISADFSLPYSSRTTKDLFYFSKHNPPKD